VPIARQAVEVRPAEARERFEPVERAGLFERLRVELDAGVRGVDAGTAAVGLLGVARVRCAVGAEEELRGSSPVAAATSAWRWRSRFSTGRQ
jgi:hypothetical protein